MNKKIIMNIDFFPRNYSKISRNEILENTKYCLSKKFGFMASYMNSTLKTNHSENINNNSTIKSNSLYKNYNAFQHLKNKILKKNQNLYKKNIFPNALKLNNSFNKNYIHNSNKKSNNNIKIIQISKKEENFNSYLDVKENDSNFLKKAKNIQSMMKNVEAHMNTNQTNLNNVETNMDLEVSNENSSVTKKEVELNLKKIFDNSKPLSINQDNTGNFNASINNIMNNDIDNDIDNDNIDENISSNKIYDNCYIINNNNVNEKISEKINENSIVEDNNNKSLTNKQFFDCNIILKGSCNINGTLNNENDDYIKNFYNNKNNNQIISDNNLYHNHYFLNQYYETNSNMFLKKNMTLSKILENQTIHCDISENNYIIDLNFLLKNFVPYEKEFKFIEDIENEMENIPKINVAKFMNLKEKCIFHFLQYIYDYYFVLIKVNSVISKKIIYSLNNIFNDMIEDFKTKHINIFKVENFYFKNAKTILNQTIVHTFNLIIVCKVITKNYNKSYDISCNYIPNNKTKIDYLWKIDIKKKNSIKVWLDSEIYRINKTFKRFTFGPQISTFSFGDEIKFIVNIFNKDSQLNPSYIEWLPPVITEIENDVYEKKKFGTQEIFDPLRSCEIEVQVLFWENPPHNNLIVNEYKKILSRSFKIVNVSFYRNKYKFYKFETIAYKAGIFSKNKFLFFDLNIIKDDDVLQNEVQCIYLMNSNYFSKKMDIRVGTKVIFYITDMN